MQMSTEGQGSASRARGDKWGKKRGEGRKEGGQAAGAIVNIDGMGWREMTLLCGGMGCRQRGLMQRGLTKRKPVGRGAGRKDCREGQKGEMQMGQGTTTPQGLDWHDRATNLRRQAENMGIVLLEASHAGKASERAR